MTAGFKRIHGAINIPIIFVLCLSMHMWFSRNTILTLPISVLNHPHRRMSDKPRLNVHAFPRPPRLEKTPRHLRVTWDGLTVADTKEGFWVLETTHPPSKCSQRAMSELFQTALSSTFPFISFVV